MWFLWCLVRTDVLVFMCLSVYTPPSCNVRWSVYLSDISYRLMYCVCCECLQADVLLGLLSIHSVWEWKVYQRGKKLQEALQNCGSKCPPWEGWGGVGGLKWVWCLAIFPFSEGTGLKWFWLLREKFTPLDGNDDSDELSGPSSLYSSSGYCICCRIQQMTRLWETGVKWNTSIAPVSCTSENYDPGVVSLIPVSRIICR